jgi:hypothetical protein
LPVETPDKREKFFLRKEAGIEIKGTTFLLALEVDDVQGRTPVDF